MSWFEEMVGFEKLTRVVVAGEVRGFIKHLRNVSKATIIYNSDLTSDSMIWLRVSGLSGKALLEKIEEFLKKIPNGTVYWPIHKWQGRWLGRWQGGNILRCKMSDSETKSVLTADIFWRDDVL